MDNVEQLDEIIDIEAVNDTLYMIGYQDGICCIIKSEDMGTIGTTFCEVGRFALGFEPTCIAILDHGWYIGCDNGDLWTSKDEGRTWEQEQYELVTWEDTRLDALEWTS